MDQSSFEGLILSYVSSLIDSLQQIKSVLNNPGYRVFFLKEELRNDSHLCRKMINAVNIAERDKLISRGDFPYSRGLEETAEGLQKLSLAIAAELEDLERESRFPSREREYEAYLKSNGFGALRDQVKSMLNSCRSLGMDTKELLARLQLVEKKKITKVQDQAFNYR